MGNDGSSVTRMMRGREKERRRRPRGRILSRQLAHYEQCMGEFNSGKSTIINALLGQRYLKEGVVPTTNEITLLLHSETESAKYSRCERNPDGQFICYLSSPILKQVAFLLYVQQWKKKVVFVLNELDLYRTSSELEEATSFVKENARRLLNSEDIRLFPVSARSALDAKLSSSSYSAVKYEEALFSDSRWMSSQFYELEKFLFSLLDGTTESGLERVKLKLETPLAIADKLLSSCQALVKQEYEIASEDLISIAGILSSVKDYSAKIESESVTWRKSITSAVETAKSRALKLTDSLLRLSNIDLIPTYALKTERAGSTFATSTFQNDIINPALSDAQRVLADYSEWSESCNSREAKLYLEHFKKQWPALVDTNGEFHLEKYSINIASGDFSSKVIENFSSGAAARLFEQEIREVVVGTFGGLGAAGLSASLLTSVLPTTLEDLLALAFCSAGGWLAISNFPRRRKETMEKVSKVADKLATELNDAMLKDLMNSVEKLNQFVEAISRPYVDAAQDRIDRSIEMQEELAKAEQNLQALRVEIQNLHVS